MTKILLHLFNLLSSILPYTSMFALKRALAKSAGIRLEKNVRLCGRTLFLGAGDVFIGENTWVGLNNTFYRTQLASIRIGKKCDLGPEVSFVTGSHEFGDATRRAGVGTGGNIEIGDGCWIGARVTILGNVKIGSGVMIAAGSVVTKDVPPNCMIAGVPAVVKKEFPDE